jgi:hypothetical protein
MASVPTQRNVISYNSSPHWQIYGASLAACAPDSGNALPLFWHCRCRTPSQAFENGCLANWHADCYVSVTKIWSTGKGFPK